MWSFTGVHSSNLYVPKLSAVALYTMFTWVPEVGHSEKRSGLPLTASWGYPPWAGSVEACDVSARQHASIIEGS